MISMIQLKQVLRNRRFVLFTILLPLAWYMFLYNIQADMLRKWSITRHLFSLHKN